METSWIEAQTAPLIDSLYQQGESYTSPWLPSFSSPKALPAGVRASLAKPYETDAMPPDTKQSH